MQDKLTYDRLLEEIKKIPAAESRIENYNNTEFVMDNDYIMQIHLIFQKFFGEDFKAPGEEPSVEDKRHAARWGGVRQEQTLYYCETENGSQCAMMWPWSDGKRVTVKITNFR